MPLRPLRLCVKSELDVFKAMPILEDELKEFALEITPIQFSSNFKAKASYCCH
jgi:hypothetical protein